MSSSLVDVSMALLPELRRALQFSSLKGIVDVSELYLA